MQKLFVIGGQAIWECDRFCMFYNKQSGSWTYNVDIIEGRINAACTYFDAKILVSGGNRKEHILNGRMSFPGLNENNPFKSIKS